LTGTVRSRFGNGLGAMVPRGRRASGVARRRVAGTV
jgi:hypothetical protein